jgi:Bacterial Ig domain/Bacterial Ig-like domain
MTSSKLKYIKPATLANKTRIKLELSFEHSTGDFMKMNFKTMLLFIALASSLIACPDNPAPINITPPTVSITSPDTSIFTKGSLTVQLAVTGEPTSVELLKDGAVLATLSAPYTYTWDTTSEAEKAYSITAKASKTGTADVVSAARQITVDRTAPIVAFQVPTAGATSVQLSNDIALTFNEQILSSSITDTTVKLEVDAFPTALPLTRTATLNSVGTKLTVKATSTPTTYPAPMNVVLNGVTDLAGNAVPYNTSFTAAAPIISGAPSIEVIVPSSPVDRVVTQLSIKVLLKNFTGSRVKYTKIFLNGKFFAIDDTPNNCPEFCFNIERYDLTSFDNGAYDVTAEVFQEDGTKTSTTVSKRMVIKIKNFDGGNGGWSSGAFTGIARPAAFNNFNPASYVRQFGDFYSARTGLNGDTVLEVTKNYPYNVPRSQDHGLYFKAILGTTSSSDEVRVYARDCKSAQECTVWNTAVIDGNNSTFTDIQFGPPNFGDTASEAAYMEIKLRFDSSSPSSQAYIGNIFVGQY